MLESTFTPKQNHLPLCPSPIGETSLFIVIGNRLRFFDLEIGRLHSRPSALLGTVALCIRFAERWELKRTNREMLSSDPGHVRALWGTFRAPLGDEL